MSLLVIIEQWDIFVRTFFSLVMIVIKSNVDARRTTFILIIFLEREERTTSLA